MSITERKPGACDREPLKTGFFAQGDAVKAAAKLKKVGVQAHVEMCVGCGLWHVMRTPNETPE